MRLTVPALIGTWGMVVVRGSRPSGWVVLGVSLLLHCLAAAGCSSPYTQRLVLDIGADGAIVAAYREVEQGHVSPTNKAFRVVRARGDQRRADSFDLGEGRGRNWESSYGVFLDPSGRFYFVAGTTTGTHLFTATSVQGDWTPVEIDPSIPSAALEALAAVERLGKAWLEGMELRVLVGTWLLTGVDGRLIEGRAMDAECSPLTSVTETFECQVSTRAGRIDAMRSFHARPFQASTLECSAAEPCRWVSTPELISSETPALIDDVPWIGRAFVHETDDRAVVLTLSESGHQVSVIGRDWQTQLDSDVLGAASRPGGGVLVHRFIEGTVNELVAIQDGVVVRTYPLGPVQTRFPRASVRTTVLVHRDAEGREIAVVAAVETGGAARIVSLDLEDGSTSQRALGF